MKLMTSTPDNRQTPFFIFLFFALIVVLHHFFAYFGHYGYDDMQYAEIAANLLRGHMDYDHSFSYRSTIVFLTAISYYFLGINDFASALPSIIISLFLLFVIFITLRKYGVIQTIAGLSATVLISVFLFYTDKIMTDIYVALFLLLAVYWIDRYRLGNKRKLLLFSFLFVASLFLAFLSKETAVLFLPLPFVLFIIDLSQKREIKFWIYSFLIGTGILAIYLVVLWIITGDPWRRFEVLAQFNQGQIYTYSYDSQPIGILLKRLYFDLFARFISEGIFILYILILPVFLTKDFRELFRVNSSFSLWMVSSLILLLSVNFMTISPFSYHPVPTDPRHSLFIIPIAAIAASFVLKDFLYEKRYKYPLLIFFSIISVISFLTDKSGFHYLYLPLNLLFLSYAFVRTHKNIRVLFVILFMIILSVKPWLFVRYSNSVVKYKMQRQIVFDYFIHSGENCFVFTDPMQKRTGRYYNGFDDSAQCIFVDYTNVDVDHFDEDFKKYLFLNYHTQHYSNTLHQLPFFVKNINSSYKLVYENPEHGIFIYEFPKLIIPEQDGIKLLETKNDFEKDYEYWTSDASNLTEEVSYSGKVSAQLFEYSSVFSLDMDSVLTEDSEKFFVKVRFQGYFHAIPSSMMVISLENDDGSYLWEAQRYDYQIRTIKSWSSISHDLSLNAEAIKPGSILKIYIWNPDNERAYIDDFGITIYHLNSN